MDKSAKIAVDILRRAYDGNFFFMACLTTADAEFRDSGDKSKIKVLLEDYRDFINKIINELGKN